MTPTPVHGIAPRPPEEQPGGRTPAPGQLAVVQAFVNTNDIEGGDEQLTDSDALATWLVDTGLCAPGTRATHAEFRMALDVREGLRALGEANGGEPLDPVRIRALNQAAEKIPLVARLAPEGWHLDGYTAGVSGGLATILSAVVEAMSDDEWSRMKACKRDRCRWLFYDFSRNRSSVWCAMEICGNKEKAVAYRRRQRARSRPSPR